MPRREAWRGAYHMKGRRRYTNKEVEGTTVKAGFKSIGPLTESQATTKEKGFNVMK